MLDALERGGDEIERVLQLVALAQGETVLADEIALIEVIRAGHSGLARARGAFAHGVAMARAQPGEMRGAVFGDGRHTRPNGRMFNFGLHNGRLFRR